MTSHLPLTAWLGWRYLRAGSAGFSKLVNVISFLGLTLGIALVIVVSSVHNGLSAELQNRLLNVVPHVFLPEEQLNELTKAQLVSLPEVISVDPEFQSLALIQGAGEQITTAIQGKSMASFEDGRLSVIEGNLDSIVDGGIALTYMVANQLNLDLGDSVRVMFAEPSSQGLLTRSSTFKLAVLFTTGTEYDMDMALVDIDSIRDMDLVSVGQYGWHIRVKEPMTVEAVMSEFDDAVTWIDLHGETFKAFQFERIAMYLVMTLVLMLASFNIIAGQSMLVNIKRGDLAILATLGLNRRSLANAFLLQGGFIAVSGIITGIVLGLLIAWNVGYLFDLIDRLFGVAILDGSLFHELPAEVSLVDTVIGSLIAICLSAFALIKPLRRVLAESPASVLNRTI